MITEASSFATIIGLLSAFSSGRNSQSTAEITDFLTWLIEHNHRELAKTVELNFSTSTSIKTLLNQQSSELNEKLNTLSETMALVASRVPDLTDFVTSILPSTELSEQAHSIILQMQKNKTEFFLVSKSMNREPQLIASNGGSITYSEAQFLHDDLETLVELSLLRLDYTSQGSEKFYFTRIAAKLASLSE